ncbi:unnamed protein product, partial [Prorocentrum cordatum]
GLVALRLVALLLSAVRGAVVDFEVDAGAVPDDDSNATVWKNGAAMNATLAALRPGDTLLLPNKTFYLMGGIQARGLDSVTLRFDGTVVFSDDIDGWPRSGSGIGAPALMCMYFADVKNLTIWGEKWWGIPGIGGELRGGCTTCAPHPVRTENRPRLLEIHGGTDILVENVFLKNSPYWSFWAHGVDGLEIRNSHVDARRDRYDGHHISRSVEKLGPVGTSFGLCGATFGLPDDTFCVKDDSENILIERVNASGIGLTIGSIASNVRNVTFRDAYMHHSGKGIYVKFRGNGRIEDVTYENIVMDAPERWAIWIGPAQQSDSRDICAAHPCSLCWPLFKPWAKCNAPDQASFINVTLRNITIRNPKMSPGVILASASSPMQNITFDNVVVENAPNKPFDGYFCEGVQSGLATGTTSP